MSRTNIDLDDAAVAVVMERYHLSTKREAVNFALQALAAEPMTTERARQMRGTGWAGDLDDMRAAQTP
jgi:Arc/MetJ family transcription regulator